MKVFRDKGVNNIKLNVELPRLSDLKKDRSFGT